MPRIAIVAALEREVAPLIRNWQVRRVEHGGRQYQFFENGNVSLVCGGIGAEAARRATEAVIRVSGAQHVLSVGFAGALDHSLRAGHIVEPRTVINAADGARTDTGRGQGALVSFASVATREQKEKLHAAYDAVAVDMEAAAVAQGAESRGLSFGALKAISDEANSTLPPLQKFVGADGTFNSSAFAVHAAIRPWLWRPTVELGRNSGLASQALCAALERYLGTASAGVADE